ncbi:MAG: fasciclin domain-containing protein [Candidatus Pedobacter colombiensis]|uniref:Fasciclin domain-containing protein n=1 Tax=Candidatus Pedobacter colombiensis TaxID=3121371 RepID=A0AAJ5W9L1_9SPHI|nr:fasciclin domain-containing protein [Pedobacter sp.]WEK19544.1 MAG: fasciclin domain-containing protein [Pedobacter sp.]
MKRNIQLIKGLLILFTAVLFVVACKKDKGAYDFDNQVNEFDGNVYEYLKAQPGVYDSLLKVVDRITWLKDTLSSPSNFTVFAPTNRSFSLALLNLNNIRVSQKKPLINLSNANLAQLDILLNRYFISGKFTTDSLLLTDGASMNTIKYHYEMHAMEVNSNAYGFVHGGPKTIKYSDVKGSQYIVEWQRTTTQAVNIFTRNAVVHVLTPSHEFGFSEFTLRLNK